MMVSQIHSLMMQREKRKLSNPIPWALLARMPVHISETMATSMAIARNGVMPIHSLTTAVTALKEMAGNCRLYLKLGATERKNSFGESYP